MEFIKLAKIPRLERAPTTNKQAKITSLGEPRRLANREMYRNAKSAVVSDGSIQRGVRECAQCEERVLVQATI